MRFVILLLACVIVAKAQMLKKDGDCPPPTPIGVCFKQCYSDFHCPGVSRCCPTDCGGSICTKPVTRRQEINVREKSGSCPSRPKGPWICTSTCKYDGDCRGRNKCCKNRCGATTCTRPES